MEWSQQQEMEDSKLDAPNEETRTMNLLREVADDITPGIKFTVDLPSNHEDGKAPMLDTAEAM